MRAAVASLVAVALVAVVAAPAAPAQSRSASFSITPVGTQPYFILDAKPGAVIGGQAQVVNVGSVAGAVAIAAVDATTGETSGAVYRATTAARSDVGAWISVPQRRLTLGPHQRVVVSFSVRVPRGARPGQHLGGLVASPLVVHDTHVTQRGKNTFRVNIREIAIVGVQVNLPGSASQRMAITSLQASGRPGYQTLLIGLANSGDTLVKGHGVLRVADAHGKPVLNQAFPLDTFVPRTAVRFPVYVGSKRLASGNYVATVVVDYGSRHRVSRTFGLPISSQQLRQTYGSTGGPSGSGSSSSASLPVWAIGLGAIGLVGLGVAASAAFFRRRPAR